MITNEQINNLIGIDESFKAPTKLMELLKNNPTELFDRFLKIESDLSYDWFTDYFQEEHSDRKGKKQDFTPDGVTTLLNRLLGDADETADICAGTGGLTIKRWLSNKKGVFYCEEFSDRAMPFLLFNLMIRKMNAYVFHGDSLSRKAKHLYKIDNGKLSEITELPNQKYNSVIMNPPYSLPWNPKDEMLKEDRFKMVDVLPPKSKADYAFILQGLATLNDNGRMVIILPHGVLFRGSREEKIRRKLIDLNLLDAVIGLPEKMFFNTSIPTVVLILKKNRTNKDILFIDASQEFEKAKAWNQLTQKHIDKIVATYENRMEVKRFSNIATLKDIQENDYNLNIPRYVDTFVPEPVMPLTEIMGEMQKVDLQIQQEAKSLGLMLQELHGANPKFDHEIKTFTKYWCDKYHIKLDEDNKGDQITLL